MGAMFGGGSTLSDRQRAYAPPQHPGAGGSVTPDLSLGAYWQIFLPNGTVTINTPINGAVGDQLIFAFIQPSSGSGVISWDPVNHAYYRENSFALTNAVNAIDSVEFNLSPQNAWGQVGGRANNLVNT